MVKKRYILIPLLGLVLGVLAIGAIGAYILFSINSDDDTEVVFAATEIGTPVGEAVTKNIGPEGGTLSSPDGRMTLTVPEDALTETILFSIQPVTNKFDGGLGLAYKLEPRGRDFTSPLEVSVRYGDRDLEGTFPDALSLAYQDDKGAWHMQREIDLDKEKKTISIDTNHFSIWSLDTRLRVSPLKSTVRVGEKVNLSVTHCDDSFSVSGGMNKLIHGVEKLLGGKTYPCEPGWWSDDKWQLVGAGEISPSRPTIIYTAPGKKPTPNTANVVFYTPDFTVRVERPCDRKGDHPIVLAGKNSERTIIRKCYESVPRPDSLTAEITIIDRAYKASGHDGPTTYSGTICDLSKPFTITGNNTLVPYPLQFVPSSASAGTLSYNATYKMLTMAGSGTYTVEGADTDTPKIVAQTKSTLSGMGRSSSGNGPAHIDLTPLDSNECDGSPINTSAGVSSGGKKTLTTQ